MNPKLLTDEALREDLYIEMMFMAGSMAVYGIKGEASKDMIEKQIDLLIPVIKRHIKRHKKSAQSQSTKQEKGE